MATARSGIADPAPIGLFGGTFDPIHCGHLHAARTARDLIGLAEVRLILSARPPHRQGPAAAVEDRWQMLVRATRGQRGLRADDREIRRTAQPSYTVDTLLELRREYGAGRSLVWCIGWDAFVEIEAWKNWAQLIELAHLAVFRRPGPTVEPSPALASLIRAQGCDSPSCLVESPQGRVLVLEASMLSVSATRVRDEIATGGDVSGLLPAAVWSYIRQHQLYGLYGGRPI